MALAVSSGKSTPVFKSRSWIPFPVCPAESMTIAKSVPFLLKVNSDTLPNVSSVPAVRSRSTRSVPVWLGVEGAPADRPGVGMPGIGPAPSAAADRSAAAFRRAKCVAPSRLKAND